MHLLMGIKSASRNYDFRLDRFSFIWNFVKNTKFHKDLIKSLYTKINGLSQGLNGLSLHQGLNGLPQGLKGLSGS